MRRAKAFLSPLRLAAVAVSLALALPTMAQAQRVALVRDAEIEALLAQYAAPIFSAAGLNDRGIEIILVNNNDFNAFVDGRRIFINTGTLMTAGTPGEVIGVIAHETGHLEGGHQQRLREQMARAQTMAVVGTLLGAGAIAAGSSSDLPGVSGAGAGMASSAGGLAMRSLLSYRRTEEIAADQAAVRYLNATGQSAAGMLATFRRFSQNLALSGLRVDAYMQSHPLPNDRIALMEELARSSPYFNVQASPELQLRHDLARAKIAAYTGNAGLVRQIFRNNPNGLAARYGDAIVTHLAGSAGAALEKMEGLIREQPNNAYFREMRGEILLRAQRGQEAAAAFGEASRLDPGGSSLIEAQRGAAIASSGGDVQAAITSLRAAISADPSNLTAYRQLAQAYGQAGDIANAELTMAEGHFRAGNRRDAQIFAMRARQKFQQGTPGWRRADDILAVSQ